MVDITAMSIMSMLTTREVLYWKYSVMSVVYGITDLAWD